VNIGFAALAWIVHHSFAFAILIRNGYSPARDYLRDHVYGWPASTTVDFMDKDQRGEDLWTYRN
jgi:hypothetical protein